MQQRLIFVITSIFTAISVLALDFGLKFQSHSFPSDQRTSLTVGDTKFNFESEFKIGFYLSFYSQSMFGNIASVLTDDGQCVSVVASRLDNGTFYLGMVINDKLYHVKHPLKLSPETPEHVELSLNKKRNVATLIFNEIEIEHPIDLTAARNASFFFGMGQENKQAVVAPFELRNIRVFIDHRNTNHWDLKFHESDTTSIDDIGYVKATVVNPHWLIDDHTDWKKIYSNKFTEKIQTAFNPANESFLIATDLSVITFSPLSGELSEINLSGGKRVLPYSNHLVYDSISGKLVNYNLKRRKIAKLDLNNKKWISDGDNDNFNNEANYSNHAVAVHGDKLYAFGGYGFYRYHNDFFIVNLTDNTITEQELTPEIMPMTSPTAAVDNGILYIFGGKGNPTGRQELPVRHSYALYAYDISTWHGEMLWELDSVEADFIPSQTMFYNSSDDCFYMASSADGGQMIRISRTKPKYEIISTSILAPMDYHDFVFDLYRSNDQKRYYLVLDKRIDPITHDYAIYTISAPFLDDRQLIDSKSRVSLSPDDDLDHGLAYTIIIISVIILAVCAGIFMYYRYSGMSHIAQKVNTSSDGQPDTVSPTHVIPPGDCTGNEEHNAVVADYLTSRKKQIDEMPKIFDRSKSAISLLGQFNVRDMNGNDITDKFTSKLKGLLTLLLLSCYQNESGIKYQRINKDIWDDKDEKSVQNNRNVTMHKLRRLLSEVGNINISYESGFFKINTGSVFFDYKEIMDRFANINESDTVTSSQVNEILELLLMGPLLPATHYSWLDPYKGEYTDKALSMLNKLLRYEYDKNDELALRIAETMSLHEPLSEEALIVKCHILCKRKMIGIAKTVYKKYATEYSASLGENYHPSFPEVCKMELQ